MSVGLVSFSARNLARNSHLDLWRKLCWCESFELCTKPVITPPPSVHDKQRFIASKLCNEWMHCKLWQCRLLHHTGGGELMQGLVICITLELHKVQVSRVEGPPRILTIQTFAKSENKFLSEKNYEGESSFFQQLLPSQHQIVEH